MAGAVACAVACGALLLPAALGAQAPGLPIVQGAFVTPGLGLGVNGAGEGEGRSAVALAAAYALAGGRVQLSGGAGLYRPGVDGLRENALTYGGRVAFAALERGRLGATAFAGFGAAQLASRPAPGVESLDVTLQQIPAGVSVGYRGALGATRAWGVSVAPMWVFRRQTTEGGSETTSANGFRVGVLAEVALSRRFGLALGVESGAGAGERQGDVALPPRGTAFGLGISVAR